MGRVGKGGKAIAGMSGAEKVTVRVKASPAFAFTGLGFHDSTAVRLRALRTLPSFSAPGGSFALKRPGCVLTDADTLSVSSGLRLKLKRTVKIETKCRVTLAFIAHFQKA
jgi:hypothetical protein